MAICLNQSDHARVLADWRQDLDRNLWKLESDTRGLFGNIHGKVGPDGHEEGQQPYIQRQLLHAFVSHIHEGRPYEFHVSQAHSLFP
jgi:hypothetical protein